MLFRHILSNAVSSTLGSQLSNCNALNPMQAGCGCMLSFNAADDLLLNIRSCSCVGRPQHRPVNPPPLHFVFEAPYDVWKPDRSTSSAPEFQLLY